MESRITKLVQPLRWPAIWVPLLILIIGVGATAIVARVSAENARALAEARYQAEHQALVNHLLANAPDYLGSGTSPDAWLDSLFRGALPSYLGLRIDTLDRHSKDPIIHWQARGPLDPTVALRTEIRPGDQRWMLTTVPSRALLQNAAKQARLTTWFSGTVLTALAVALALALCRKLHQQRQQIAALHRSEIGADQQINNLQVEKAILRQALNDSEARSRDLVELSGAIISELDEQGMIGFVSSQTAELLERAPTDLMGQAFESLIADSYRENFRRTLTAARQDNQAQRIDLDLLSAHDQAPVPVIVRLKALKDPVHGITGYRLSAVPNTTPGV